MQLVTPELRPKLFCTHRLLLILVSSLPRAANLQAAYGRPCSGRIVGCQGRRKPIARPILAWLHGVRLSGYGAKGGGPHGAEVAVARYMIPDIHLLIRLELETISEDPIPFPSFGAP